MSQATTVAWDESDSDTLVYSSDSSDIRLTNAQIAAIFKAIKEGHRKKYKDSSPQMRALIRRLFREA